MFGVCEAVSNRTFREGGDGQGCGGALEWRGGTRATAADRSNRGATAPVRPPADGQDRAPCKAGQQMREGGNREPLSPQAAALARAPRDAARDHRPVFGAVLGDAAQQQRVLLVCGWVAGLVVRRGEGFVSGQAGRLMRHAALLCCCRGGGRSQLDQRQRRPDAAPAHGCVGLKTEAPVPIPLAIEHHHRQPSHPEHGFTVASWPLGGQGGRRFSACLAVGRALSKRKTHTRVPPRRTSSGSHGPLVMSSYSCPFMLSGPSIRGPAGLGPPKSVRVSLLL